MLVDMVVQDIHRSLAVACSHVHWTWCSLVGLAVQDIHKCLAVAHSLVCQKCCSLAGLVVQDIHRYLVVVCSLVHWTWCSLARLVVQDIHRCLAVACPGLGPLAVLVTHCADYVSPYHNSFDNQKARMSSFEQDPVTAWKRAYGVAQQARGPQDRVLTSTFRQWI